MYRLQYRRTARPAVNRHDGPYIVGAVRVRREWVIVSSDKRPDNLCWHEVVEGVNKFLNRINRMRNKDKFFYRLKDGIEPIPGNDGICYREPWVIVANLILKILQPWTDSPFLVCATSTSDGKDPHFEGYTVKRVQCVVGYFERAKDSIFSGALVVPYYKGDK